MGDNMNEQTQSLIVDMILVTSTVVLGMCTVIGLIATFVTMMGV